MPGNDIFTKLLLPFETDYTDQSASGHTVTAQNGALISAAQAKFGSESGYFDGTDDYLLLPASSDWEWGSDNFSIDFWWYSATTNRQWFIHSDTDYWFGLDYNVSGLQKIGLWASSNGSSWDLLTGSGGSGRCRTNVTLSQWNHIAMSREGDVWRVFLNGALDLEVEVAGSIVDRSTEDKYIGSGNGGSTNFVNGYLDEFRISKGVARWTEGFEVPERAYDTDQSKGIDQYTKLMIQCDKEDGSRTIENSPLGCSVIVNGNAQIDTNEKKFGSSSLKTGSSSGYFTLGPSFPKLGNNDFTIDFWYKRSSGTYLGFFNIYQDNSNIYGFRYDTSNEKIEFSGNKDGQTYIGYVYHGAINFSTFRHVALVRESNDIRIYIDGVALDLSIDVAIGNKSIDFSAVPYEIGKFYSGYYNTGWFDDFRISDYARWTSDFTPPTSAVETDDHTLLLLNGEGYYDYGDIVDTSGNSQNITVNGDTFISSTDSKFGEGNIEFDGSDNLAIDDSSDFDIGISSSPFTIDFWVKTTTSAVQAIFNRGGNNNNDWSMTDGNQYLVQFQAAAMYFYYNDNGTARGVSQSISLDGNWHHVAIVYDGTTTYVYVDGTRGSGVTTGGYYKPSTSDTVTVGEYQFSAGGGNFTGSIDEFRISKGVARWTSNFTPPTSPYEDSDIDSYTVLLLQAEAVYMTDIVKDYSKEKYTIEHAGDAQIDTDVADPWGNNDGVLMFDGTGDWVNVSHDADFNFSSDFSIDFYVRFNALANYVLLSHGGNGTPDVQGWNINFLSAGSLVFNYNDGSSDHNHTVSWSPVVDTWYHLTFVRHNDTLYSFIDGTLTGTTASYPYNISSTEDLRIGSGYDDANSLNGYMAEIRISKDIARWNKSFTVPAGHYYEDLEDIDPFVVFLLFNGGIGGRQGFVDLSSSKHSIFPYGDIQVEEDVFRFPDGSCLNTQSGDYLFVEDSDDWDMGTSDFEIDFWIYKTANVPSGGIVSFGDNTGTDGFAICWDTTNGTRISIKKPAGSAVYHTSTGVVSLNTWTHVAIVRDGDNLRVFFDGVQDSVKAGVAAVNFNSSGTGMVIGRLYTNEDVYYHSGNIDELRITKGLSRWTTNFNLPTEPYYIGFEGETKYWGGGTNDTPTGNWDDEENWTNDQKPNALDNIIFSEILGDDEITELTDATERHKVTVVSTSSGRVETSLLDPFGNYGGCWWTAADGSGYNGASIYLFDSSDWDFETNPFTIDFWYRPRNSYSWSYGNIMGTGYNIAGGFNVYMDPNYRIKLRVVNVTYGLIPADILTPDEWNHVAIVREGIGTDEFKIYVNGTQQSQDTLSYNFVGGTQQLYIGGDPRTSGGIYGRLCEMRISRGIARWSGDFTPPTERYSEENGGIDSYTKLLLHFDSPAKEITNCTINEKLNVQDLTVDSSYTGEISNTTHSIGIGGDLTVSSESIDFGTSDVFVRGNIDVAENSGITGGNFHLRGLSGTKNIDFNGSSLDSLTVNANGATKVLSSNNFSCGDLTIEDGTLDSTNSPNITTSGITATGGTWNDGSGNISVAGSLQFSGLTYSKVGGILRISTASDSTVDFGGASVGNIVLAATSGDILVVSGFTCTSLQVQVTSPNEIYWYGNTYNINGLFSCSGNGSWNSASLVGTTFNVDGNFIITDTNLIGDNLWFLNVTGSGSGYNTNVKNSDASGGSVIYALTGTDLGGNSNWYFGYTPVDENMQSKYSQTNGMFILQCSDIPLDIDAWSDIIWVDANAVETFGDDPSLLYAYKDATRERYRIYSVKMNGFVRENDKVDLTRVLRNYPLNTSILQVYKLEISDKHLIAYCNDSRNAALKTMAVVLENAAYNLPLEFQNNDINMSYDVDVETRTRENQPWYRLTDDDGNEIEDEEVQAMKDVLAIYSSINSNHDSLGAKIDLGFTGQKIQSTHAPDSFPVVFANLGEGGITKQAKEQCGLKIQDQLFLRRDGDPDDVNCDCSKQRSILYVYDFEPMNLFYDLDTMTPDPDVSGCPSKVELKRIGLVNDIYSGFEDVCRFESDWFTYSYDNNETFLIQVRHKIRLNLYNKYQGFIPFCGNDELEFNWGMHHLVQYLGEDPTTTISPDWITALDEEIYMPRQLYNECNPVGIFYTTNIRDDGSTIGCPTGLKDPWDVYDIEAAKISLV